MYQITTFTFNIVGPANKITALVDTLKIETKTNVVSDHFPSKPGQRDINISIEDKFVDFFTDLCEEENIKYEMI